MNKFYSTLFLITILILKTNFAFATPANINEIIKLYNESEYQKVIDLLSAKNPEELTTEELYYLGLSNFQVKNLKSAANAFEMCVKIDSSKISYRLNYARTLNLIGRANEAITNYDFIIKKDSTNTAALYDLGFIYTGKKDFPRAKKIFTKLSELNKKDFLSAYYLALCAYQTCETHEDTLRVNDLIFNSRLLNFEYIPSAELSGIYDLNRNNFASAVVSYSLLTKLNPENAEYFYRAGFCYEKMKDYDSATVFFKKAVKLDSTIANYYSHLGYAHFMLEKYDSSLSAYLKAAVLDPENSASYLNIGLVYEKMDSLDLASAYYEKALQFYPYSKIVYTAEKLIEVNYRLKNYEQVQVLCDQVLALAPKSVQSLFYSACSYDAAGKTDLALERYKSAADQLKNDERFKNEFNYVTTQIEKIKSRDKERKFWEGKINE